MSHRYYRVVFQLSKRRQLDSEYYLQQTCLYRPSLVSGKWKSAFQMHLFTEYIHNIYTECHSKQYFTILCLLLQVHNYSFQVAIHWVAKHSWKDGAYLDSWIIPKRICWGKIQTTCELSITYEKAQDQVWGFDLLLTYMSSFS